MCQLPEEFDCAACEVIMQLAEIRLLSFDCYGTLIDWELGITETVSGLAAVHGVHPTDAEVRLRRCQ